MSRIAETLSAPQRQAIATWLALCCVLIFAMVILGGVTRLTGSGLSMVEWDPLFGILPPLNDAEWEAVFAKYRASPEYQQVNIGMDVHGFKSIYWFEYAHRILGRTIGLVFLLPLLFFLWRGYLNARLAMRFGVAFILGGLQGLLGWYMVKSGLVDRPHVSQYRLTAHLSLALLIYGYLLWLLLDVLSTPRPALRALRSLRATGTAVLALIGVTIVSGGFVAGLKAGLAYNTFPKMGEQWLPPAGWMLQPGWRNLFENVATVQFDHRVLALTTLVAVTMLWLLAWRRLSDRNARIAINLLLLAVCGQVALGITTLLNHVPVALGAAHQGGAMIVLSLALWVTYRLWSLPRPPATAGFRADGQAVGGY